MRRKTTTAPSQMNLLEARVSTAPCVPAIREAVTQWRQSGYRGATSTTRALLSYWFATDHRLPNGRVFAYHYGQREAIETLIYLYEVAGARRQKDLVERFASRGDLRPYSSKANILPEQTIGRGLRLMFRDLNTTYVERVDVIGNKKFIESRDFPVLPRKEGDLAAQQFRYEGYDILTLQKLIEREYTIPEPQTAQEVISYYAKRIAQDLKLPSQFAHLVPKVREFLETKAFGEPVSLETPAMIKAISSNVAHYVTVKTFAAALRNLVVEEQIPHLLNAGRKLSETPPFPHSRVTLAATRTVFNQVACDNDFERRFAQFLEGAPDVSVFAKLPSQFGFAIEYTDAATNLRYYEPDFAVVLADGSHYLVETKGREDIHVAHKDRAARIGCMRTRPC